MKNFLIGALVAVSLGLSSGFYAWNKAWSWLEGVRSDLPRIDEAGSYHPPTKTRILAADGTLLTEIYRENREYIALEQIPKALRQATIASEDRRFYRHIGVSPYDIARAAVANYRRRAVTQGASTITQQLARDLYLSNVRTMERKVKEALLALELEKRYTKDELLELYLNEINYGRGSYGVRTAARMYFGKEPADLTAGECAALAAIPRRPTSYNLYDDPKGAKKRRDEVLDRMVDDGYLSSSAARTAKAEELKPKPYSPPNFAPRAAPYYTTYAVRELCDLVGEEKVYTGGLTVKTCVRLDLQEVADDAVRNAVARASDQGATQGAAVLLDVRTGEILAMCGGIDSAKSQFNRATQARRQPGSAFKPFVYATALEHGFKPTDTITDKPLTVHLGPGDVWEPKNYDGVFRGQVTLTEALAKSINVPAVRLCQRVGVTNVIGLAQRMGVSSPLRPYLSLALGSSEVTLLELVSAYTAFPGMGNRVAPTTIAEVRDNTGKVIYRLQPKIQSVLNPRAADQMVGMLAEVMNSGTGQPASFGGPHGGKTGTTSENRDAWFVGFTPQFCAGVWLGDDHNQRMHSVYGGTVCGPAWRTLIRAAVKARGDIGTWARPWYAQQAPPSDAPVVNVEGDRVTVRLKVCADSGLLPGPGCRVVEQTYDQGTQPTAHCMLHQEPAEDDKIDTRPVPGPSTNTDEPKAPDLPKPAPEPEGGVGGDHVTLPDEPKAPPSPP